MPLASYVESPLQAALYLFMEAEFSEQVIT